MTEEEPFSSLVVRVAARLFPIPIVTPEQYRQITCNRCGLCCEDIRAEDPPDVCRFYPYGKVVRSWRECAWFVEVRDEHGHERRGR